MQLSVTKLVNMFSDSHFKISDLQNQLADISSQLGDVGSAIQYSQQSLASSKNHLQSLLKIAQDDVDRVSQDLIIDKAIDRFSKASSDLAAIKIKLAKLPDSTGKYANMLEKFKDDSAQLIKDHQAVLDQILATIPSLSDSATSSSIRSSSAASADRIISEGSISSGGSLSEPKSSSVSGPVTFKAALNKYSDPVDIFNQAAGKIDAGASPQDVVRALSKLLDITDSQHEESLVSVLQK